MVLISTATVTWTPSHRLIPSRFPPVELFERVARPADLEAVLALESLTNPRIRQEVGELALVPPEERVAGPGTGYIMAAFTHLNPSGSRFSDGTFGIYYAADSVETAIAETVFHQVRYLRETSEPAQNLQMREILADLRGELWDLCGPGNEALHDPDPATYSRSREIGRQARAAGADGLHYHSVRRHGAFCAAVLRPKVLSRARQSRHFLYPWNGTDIPRDGIAEIRPLKGL